MGKTSEEHIGETPDELRVPEFQSLSELCEYFDLGQLIETKTLEGGSESRTACLITSRGKYILKTYLTGSLEKLAIEADFLEFLKRNNFKCGAVHSPEVFIFDGSYSLIFNFVEGSHPEINLKNLGVLGVQTATFHQLSAIFPGVKGLQNENDTLPKFYIHRDLCRENIIQNDEDFYFIDFEDLRIDTPVRDIVRIIETWCVGDAGEIDVDRVNLFIEEYEKSRPLSEAEKRQIPGLFESLLMSKLNYRSSTYAREQDPVKKEKLRLSVIHTQKMIDAFTRDRSILENL